MNIQKRNSIGFMVILLFLGSMAFASPVKTHATYLDPDVPIIDVKLKVRFTEPSSLMLKEISTPFTLQTTDIQDINMLAEVGDYDDVKASTFMDQATTVTYSSSWSFVTVPTETMLAGATADGNFQTLSGIDESSLDYWDNKLDTQFRSWIMDKDVRELLSAAAEVYNNSWDWSDLGQTTQYLVMTLDSDVVDPMLDAMYARDDFEVGVDAEMSAGDMTDVAENIFKLAGGTTNTYFGVWNSTLATDPFECVTEYLEDDTNITGMVELNNIHTSLYGYVGYTQYAAPTAISLAGVAGGTIVDDRWSIRLNADEDYEVALVVDSTLENSTNDPIDNYLIQLTSMIPLISDLAGIVADPDTTLFAVLVWGAVFGVVGVIYYLIARSDNEKENKELRKGIFLGWFLIEVGVAFIYLVLLGADLM